ncbi:MAG: nicotinate-nucleotide adenylyltransferase [Glaciecola sp.]|jgi:nicotinate-nucleotide adenylyltransferase
MTTSQPITLFGGTFNPPHWGHIKPLKQAMKALDIATVGLLPCNIPPHKKRLKISNKHRLEMLKIVCKLEPSLYVENIELESNDVSFTVNTLKKLKKNNHQSMFFVMGSDSFQSLKTWHQWQEILQLCNIIVLNRNNQPLKILKEVTQFISCGPHHAVSLADKQALSTNNGIVVSCHFPTVPVSSTLIREKLEKKDYQQLEMGELLPLEVIRYIKQHQLYEPNKL